VPLPKEARAVDFKPLLWGPAWTLALGDELTPSQHLRLGIRLDLLGRGGLELKPLHIFFLYDSDYLFRSLLQPYQAWSVVACPDPSGLRQHQRRDGMLIRQRVDSQLLLGVCSSDIKQSLEPVVVRALVVEVEVQLTVEFLFDLITV